MYYVVPISKLTEGEKRVVDAIKQVATRTIQVDPTKIRDPKERRDVFLREVLRIIETSPELGVPEAKKKEYATIVVRDMVGYGDMDFLIMDDFLEEIMIIGPKKPTYVFHRKHGMLKSNIKFETDKEIQNIVDKIAREVGRRVDINNPLLDARLADGSRVNATIPPASIDGSTVTLRKFRSDPLTIVDLINYKTVNLDIAAFIWVAMEGFGAKPSNVLVSGGTASGKTTTLNTLASFIPPDERVISIEDTAELRLPLDHWIRFESRPPSIEGKGEITMDVLVKNALRMRPDRIIVGEIRHKEAEALFTAINTGHDGSMGTVHANSVDETIVRVTSPPMSVPNIMMAGLDLVIMQKRINDRRKGLIRRVTEIGEVTKATKNDVETNIIWKWDAANDSFELVDENARFFRTLSSFTGLSKDEVWAEIENRKRILGALYDRGIRDFETVIKVTRAYIMKSKGM